MKMEEIREQLESLLSESRYMASQEDADEIFKADQEALEEVLDILHDYEQQSILCRRDFEFFHTTARPVYRNEAWHCPACGRMVFEKNMRGPWFCKWCGKWLDWCAGQEKRREKCRK